MHAHAPSPYASAIVRTVVLARSERDRTRLSRAIEADGLASVVYAADDLRAVQIFMHTDTPNVIVLDPAAVPDELADTIRQWTRTGSITVVVATTDPDTAVLAMSAGAAVATPTPSSDDLGSPHADRLRKAVASASRCQAIHRPPTALHTLPDLPFARAEQRSIAIVGGMGSAAALESLIAHLPPSVPGIVAMLDVHPDWLDALARRLDRCGVLDVSVAEDGDVLLPGRVCLTPSDRQVTIVRSNVGHFVLRVGERLTAPPSPDAFLRSVAANAGRSALGVLLGTHDERAAVGLYAMRREGSRTLAEDPDSAVAGAASELAMTNGAVDELTHLRRMPWRILEESLVTVVP